MDKVEAIEVAVEAMRDDPFIDDYRLLGTTAQDQRMAHYASIALTAAEPFFEPGTTLNECIAELGDDEPFVVQRGPDGWEVRKMTAWKVLNPEVFADVRDQWLPIETAPKDGTWIFACQHCGNDDIRHDYYAAAWCGDEDGFWMSACGQYVTETPDPTHWRPLPDPPALDEVVGTGEEQGNEWDDLR